MNPFVRILTVGLLLFGANSGERAAVQQTAQPSVSATEIKIGNTTCYTGPAKEYGTVARAKDHAHQLG